MRTRPSGAGLESIRWHTSRVTSAPEPDDARADRSAEPSSGRPSGGRRLRALPWLTPNRAGLVVLIGSFTLVPAVASDMYLPSLPEVASDLGTTAAGAQFTITGMVLGGAVGTLVVGPLSDRLGRRRPALAGVTSHVVLSLLCMVAPSIAVLSALRVVQGFTASAATVCAMAVVRDRYHGAEVAHFTSRIMLVIGAAPLLAPTLGAWIAQHGGWRAVFGWLAAFGALVLLFALLALPETLPPERRRRASLLSGYREVLADGRFRALAVMPGVTQAVVISYVSGSPFVLREQYGMSAGRFSLVFAIGGVALVLGAQLNAGLVRRVGPARLLRIGLPSMVLGAVAMLVVALGHGSVWAFLAALWWVLASIGTVASNASAIALQRHGDRAGTAGATMGALQSGLAGAISPLVGVLGAQAVDLAAVVLGTAVAGTLVLALATPAYRRDGWIALGAD